MHRADVNAVSLSVGATRSFYPLYRGTYHLGTRAIESLLRNCADKVPAGVDIKELKTTFRIACLMHDCGHAPFSHTFEGYYRVTRDPQPGVHPLDRLLFDLMPGDKFIKADLEPPASPPACHEQVSAIILLSNYANSIRDLGGDPELAARMIMGCVYQKHEDSAVRFKNAVISLLNGASVDVDKLDYITRDTWASGVDNVHIDLDRVLSSLTVVVNDDQHVLAFQPNALSVIQGVVDARNFLYRWVFTHHKVIYSEHLLKQAVEKTVAHLTDPPNAEENLIKLFSVDSFTEYVDLGKFRFHLVSDGDLIYAMKCFQDSIEEARELLTRDYRRKAVWKSRAEFRHIFQNQPSKKLNMLAARLKSGLLDAYKEEGAFLYLEAKAKDIVIEPNEVLFDLGSGEFISYDRIFHEEKRDDTPFFFVYQDTSCTVSRNELLDYLKKVA